MENSRHDVKCNILTRIQRSYDCAHRSSNRDNDYSCDNILRSEFNLSVAQEKPKCFGSEGSMYSESKEKNGCDNCSHLKACVLACGSTHTKQFRDLF